METDSDILFVQAINGHMHDGNTDEAIRLMRQNPDVVNRTNSRVRSWLNLTVGHGHLAVVDYLLEAGYDINSGHGVEKWTVLDEALLAGEALDRPRLVKALLDRGADPNVSRPLIGSINPRQGDDAASLELVRLLVEVGRADVAREYDRFGNKDDTFTALEFAEMNGRPAVAAYLRSKGATDRPARPVPPPAAKRKGR